VHAADQQPSIKRKVHIIKLLNSVRSYCTFLRITWLLSQCYPRVRLDVVIVAPAKFGPDFVHQMSTFLGIEYATTFWGSTSACLHRPHVMFVGCLNEADGWSIADLHGVRIISKSPRK